MHTEQFWKNFKLGKELDVSGAFIYNGLQVLHEMKNFECEDEIFEFLYNISVGFERLMKVVIILTEYNVPNEINGKEFENSLKTHNHEQLLQRLRKHHHNQLNFSAAQNDFIKLLNSFYKNARYERYNYSAMFTDNGDFKIEDWEEKNFKNFIEKCLEIELKTDGFIIGYIKKDIEESLVKIIEKISEKIYNLIEPLAHCHHIDITDIRHRSKAEKIFRKKEYSFDKIDLLRRELFIALIKDKNNLTLSDKVLEIIETLQPLNIDITIEGYIESLDANIKAERYTEDLDEAYLERSEVENIKERKENVMAID